MPIPIPRSDESKKVFMRRCMDSMASDYPDNKQRAAICYGAWGKKGSNNMESRSIRNNIVTFDISLLKTGTLNGRSYLIAPAVPIVAGVHNSELVVYEDLIVWPEMWSGCPLPIDHPKDIDGEPATANSPEVMQNSVIGILFNVKAREDIQGIAGELWIDIEKAAEVPGGSEVVRRLQAGEQLEVSTAYFCLVDNVAGDWRNPKTGQLEHYTSSQTQLRPDHLALLPYDMGACNWKDGCGAPRINNENLVEKIDHTLDSVNKDGAMQVRNKGDIKLQFKQIQNGDQMENALNLAIAAHVATGETQTAIINRLAVACGIDSTRMKSLIAGELDFVPKHWLEVIAAVLDIDPWDLFMASSNDNMDARYTAAANADTENNSTKVLATVTTSHNETDTACAPCQKTLKTKVLEILQSMGVIKGTDLKEENTQMATNAETKKAKVDALIASKLNQFSETSREWLTSLSDEQLATLEPVAVAEVKVEPAAAAAAATTNVAAVETKEVVVKMSKEDILATLGIDESALTAAKAINEEKKTARNAKVSEIKALAKCPYTEAELNTFSDATLDKTLEMLQPTNAYRVTPGTRQQSDADAVSPAPAILLVAPTKEAK